MPLVGCGGGDDNNTPTNTAELEAAPMAHAQAVTTLPVDASRATAAPAPAPAPVAASAIDAFSGAMAFTLTFGRSATQAPFSLGFAFRKGDVPAGSTVTSSAGRLQVTPRSTWPDGSLRFAQLSGYAAGTAGSTVTFNLKVGPNTPMAGMAPLGLSDLKRTGLNLVIGAGSFGSASFAGTDWDTPFQTWVTGTLMSSWVFRKPVGADKHLVAWVEVRLFVNGAIEVLPWVENGYLQVAGPSNRKATYSVSINGQSRFQALIDLPHHCRTPLLNGTALSYWLGEDPLVTPVHDLVYLQSTELVPTYAARVPATAGAIQALPASYTPLQQGSFNYATDDMATSGYQQPIGLLPQHDVLYLTSGVPATYAGVVRNGYSAGRYAIHYRDEKTQRPIRLSAYPNLVLSGGSSVKDTGGSTTNSFTPRPSGTPAPLWDVAHSPSVGYLAYLVTGRWYFMEEVQFAATTNYLTKSDIPTQRGAGRGLVQTATQAWQTRACAWDWRSLIQAAAVTPDNDTALRQEFLASIDANIQFFHKTYVAQPNNPFGWIMPGETYGNSTGTGAPWQQDFVTAVFGWSISLDLPLADATKSKLREFFTWKARSAVMRLGDAKGFWYVNGTPYNMTISPSTQPDYLGGKGPWLADDAAVYAATYANPPAWFANKTDGKLNGEILPGETAYWGNLMPAIAYAVRHGVPGASLAYSRLTNASNFGSLRDAFNNAPVWSVIPTSGIPIAIPHTLGALPAWMAGKAVGEWIEIPNTAGAGGATVDAYSGMALNDATGEIYIAAAGGHQDSSDNRVVSIRLHDDAPKWVVRRAASTRIAQNVHHYPDGMPSARHTYSAQHYVPQLKRIFCFGARFVYGSAWSYSSVDAFAVDTNTWDPAGTWPDMPNGSALVATQIRSTGEIITGNWQSWSPNTKAWTNLVTKPSGDSVRWPMAYDSKRNQLFSLQWGDGQGYDPFQLSASRVHLGSSTQVSVRFNPSAALTQWLADKPSYAAMDYDADNDRFLFYDGQGSTAGRIYVVKPNDGNTWDMSLLSVRPSGARLPSSSPGGLHNRLRYVPTLKGFVLLANAGSNLYFLRTA